MLGLVRLGKIRLGQILTRTAVGRTVASKGIPQKNQTIDHKKATERESEVLKRTIQPNLT
jgi:hypothetical protein